MLAVALAVALTLSTTPGAEHLVGSKGLSEVHARAMAKSAGRFIQADPTTGLYRVWGITDDLKRAGFRFVLPANPPSGDLRRAKYQGELRRAQSVVNGYAKSSKGSPGFAGALEWYLRDRVTEEGILDRDRFMKAAKHREQMPKARAEWFGEPGDNAAGYFSQVGPGGMDMAYHNQWFGPAPLTGRKNDVAISPQDTNRIYAASAGGGIWRSNDGGQNWTPKSDSWTFLNCATVDVHPTNKDILLAGTGDPEGKFEAQTFGIMRSTTGGNTWETPRGVGVLDDQIITEIRFLPDDPNIVFASTLDPDSSTGGDVYISRDAGVTWAASSVPGDEWMDLDIGPRINGLRTIMAIGTGKIAYTTSDGDAWSWRTTGVPTAGKSDIAVSQNQAGVCYVVTEQGDEVYRVTNYGLNWTSIKGNGAIAENYQWSQSWYDLHIACGKNGNQDALVVGLISLWMSPNAGTNWYDVGKTDLATARTHNDQHDFVFHPNQEGLGYACNDGGLYIVSLSYASPAAATFANINGDMADHLIYDMALHPTDYENRMLAGFQDNGAGGARGNTSNWVGLASGDGGGAGYDTTSPGIHYVTTQYGAVKRFDSAGDPEFSVLSSDVDGPFTTPLVMGGPGGSYVYTAWDGRVKRFDPYLFNWTTPSGSANVSRLAKGRVDTHLYAFGSNIQPLHYSVNGTSFRSADGNLPSSALGDVAEAWGRDHDVVAVVSWLGGGGAYRSTNLNLTEPTWTNISGSGATALPDINCNAVLRDPHDPSTFYVGTDVGMFMTVNAGSNWYNMGSLGFPNVHVTDLELSNDQRYMYVSTFGRGIWRIRLKAVGLTSLTTTAPGYYGGTLIPLTATLDSVVGAGLRVNLVDNTNYVATPYYIQFPGGTSTASTTLLSTATPTDIAVTITGTLGSQTRTRNFTLYANPVVTMSSTPSAPQWGENINLTIDAGRNLPAAATIVLTKPTGFGGPSSVNFSAGQRSRTVTLTHPVTQDPNEDVVVRAKFSFQVPTVSHTLNMKQRARIQLFAFTPGVVTGGQMVNGRVTLDKDAPQGGITVTFESNNTAIARPPASTVISAGGRTRDINISTTRPAVLTNVGITATAPGRAVTSNLTVMP